MMIGQIGRIGLHHLVAMNDCRGVKMIGGIGLFHLDLMTSRSEAMPIGGIGLLHLVAASGRQFAKIIHLVAMSGRRRDKMRRKEVGVPLAVIIGRHDVMTLHHHAKKTAGMDVILDASIEEMSGPLHPGNGHSDAITTAKIGALLVMIESMSDPPLKNNRRDVMTTANILEEIVVHLFVTSGRHVVRVVVVES